MINIILDNIRQYNKTYINGINIHIKKKHILETGIRDMSYNMTHRRINML